MHDFLLAKDIIEALKRVAVERGLKTVTHVSIEIGSIALSHDGMPEHTEYVSVENLRFGLEHIAKGTLFQNAEFDIRKTAGENWKISSIDAE